MKGTIQTLWRRHTLFGALVLLCLSFVTSCSSTSAYPINASLAASTENVTLRFAGRTQTFKALDSVFTSFNKIYPHCNIEYECIQNYDTNLAKRLADETETSPDKIDLFITNNINDLTKGLGPYALELYQQKSLNLSATHPGLLKNFSINGINKEIYAIPMGSEVRGMYVNKTLLATYGLATPKNWNEFLAACKTIYETPHLVNGVNVPTIPVQGNPGTMSIHLMYPYVCDLIANATNYQEVYAKVNSCEEGVSALFAEPMKRLYELVEKSYYNYDFVETNYKNYLSGSEDVAAFSFLNISQDESGNYVKKDDIGNVPFMPLTLSFDDFTLARTKSNYHSAIDYEFILSPMGDDGGFAYLSPATGIAINKKSIHTSWAIEFLNYFFSESINKSFAKEQGLFPNTKDAADGLSSRFSIPEKRTSDVGQVTFDYIFYDIIKPNLIAVSKGNKAKYMQADGTMYPLSHYMELLEKSFADQRAVLGQGSSASSI